MSVLGSVVGLRSWFVVALEARRRRGVGGGAATVAALEARCAARWCRELHITQADARARHDAAVEGAHLRGLAEAPDPSEADVVHVDSAVARRAGPRLLRLWAVRGEDLKRVGNAGDVDVLVANVADGAGAVRVGLDPAAAVL